jgi:A/G-specific adenine glycosylase
LPWREPGPGGRFDPYAVLVSELMLQQTQVLRVIPKYKQFMALFPTVADLADADLSSVLRAWSGLGYNRRAKYLWQAAKQVMDEHGGVMPQTLEKLVRLPGVGVNTAGAVLAYAFDRPVVFIETNIRTVFIHHFFADASKVSDKELRPLIEATLPGPGEGSNRDWYYGLMDYGSSLKKSSDAAARSAHYARQPPLEGSRRQIRGRVLKTLSERPKTGDDLAGLIKDGRLESVLDDLLDEGLVRRRGHRFYLGS